jgi:DNA-binding NarL/FixJ family response regulator
MTLDARIVLVDDHQMFRQGIRTILSADEGMRVVFEATDAATMLLELDRGLEFDLALVDITLPDTDGLSLVRELRRRDLMQPVVMVSMHTDVDMVAEALIAGAQGYVLKCGSANELREAIGTVLRGGRHVPSAIDSGRLFTLLKRKQVDDDSPLRALSPREREIFDLLVRGFSRVRVSDKLTISSKTVATHQQHIFGKLGVHSVIELVRLAARHNLLAAV